MRFLLQTQCFAPIHGGIEALMSGLAGALGQLNHDVVVRADGKAAPGDAGFDFELHRYGGLKALRRRKKRRDAHRDLKARRFDGIICDSWKSAEGLQPGPVPLLCLAHGDEFTRACRDRRRAERVSAALASAACVVANSRHTAKLVETVLNGTKPIAVVHPPFASLPPPSDAARIWFHERWGDDVDVVLFLGRLQKRKGADMLITAISRLRAPGVNVRLVIAGDGQDRSRLESLAAECLDRDCCAFVGRVSDDEKSALLDGATIFAMPVRDLDNSTEGFGIVYREAAQFGVPALAGAAGGAAEAVRDGITGLICDGRDSADVAAKLGVLLQHRRYTSHLGRNARQGAMVETWPDSATKYIRLIKNRTS